MGSIHLLGGKESWERGRPMVAAAAGRITGTVTRGRPTYFYPKEYTGVAKKVLSRL